MESNKFSPTDILSIQHDYDLSLLNQETDTPSGNLHHQDTHVCEKQDQDDFLIHATNLSHNFALPQFMAQHQCEDLKPTDTPSTFSTFTQASSDHTSNQICAHNSMVTQHNQSQYPTLLKQICSHNPSASQVSQANLSNYLTSQYPPDPGEHVLKKSATEIGEQDFPVKWFKFICPSSKSRMTKTSTFAPVHVVYSPIAFMNHQWTINLHDGYPPLHVLLQEEYIPPSLPIFCNLLSTMFHFGDDYLCPTKAPYMTLQVLLHQKGRWQVLSVRLVFSRVPHQALYVLVTLHLQSSIKSSCCVKQNFISPSTFLFVTLFFILELHFCSHPRPDYTSQRCIFKANILQLHVKYNQKKLKKPHLPILPRSTHLTKVYKSLSNGTEDINWQMNAMLLTQVPCPIMSTFYPRSEQLALLDHTFAEYLFLCLIDGKTLFANLTKSIWIMDKPSMFGTPSSLLLQTLLSLFQDLLSTHTNFLTATPSWLPLQLHVLT